MVLESHICVWSGYRVDILSWLSLESLTLRLYKLLGTELNVLCECYRNVYGLESPSLMSVSPVYLPQTFCTYWHILRYRTLMRISYFVWGQFWGGDRSYLTGQVTQEGQLHFLVWEKVPLLLKWMHTQFYEYIFFLRWMHTKAGLYFQFYEYIKSELAATLS